MSNTILFVYGTLKRGMKSHHFLADQEFLGAATTMPLYRLYNFGWHPGMVLDPNGLDVQGELYAVDAATLAKLDDYEGLADGWYVRSDVAVRDCFETVQAYFFNSDLPDGAASGGKWPFEM